MVQASRHNCLIYNGPPSQQLPAIASVIQQKLKENFRCLYLNSQPMVAGIRSYLAAAGVDVAREEAENALVLTSQKDHLLGDWQFDTDRMIQMLGDGLQRALADGYAGLWAIGDMAWEFGPERNFAKLIEYEQRLEEFLRTHPQIGGICEYHADILPREVIRTGLLTHPKLFVNETLTIVNPHFLRQESAHTPVRNFELDGVIDRFLNERVIG